MCVTWVHVHSCNHNETHEHRCYSIQLNRGCPQKYQCALLETEIPCNDCMSKRWRRLPKMKLESNRRQYKAIMDVMEDARERLLGVIKQWHETCAGASPPVLAVFDGEADSGWTRTDIPYIPTPEWKANVSNIIRDEIAPCPDNLCDCGECEIDEEDHEILVERSNITVMQEVVEGCAEGAKEENAGVGAEVIERSNITVMREMVEGWLEEEKEERAEVKGEGGMHLVPSPILTSSDSETSKPLSE